MHECNYEETIYNNGKYRKFSCKGCKKEFFIKGEERVWIILMLVAGIVAR